MFYVAVTPPPACVVEVDQAVPEMSGLKASTLSALLSCVSLRLRRREAGHSVSHSTVVRGVARQAQHVSQALEEVDRPYLVAAAWLHDIGCASTLAATAFHPLDGARHLRALRQEPLARLVAYHSSARWEAEALGLSDELAAFPREESAAADALTYCDMTTSPAGKRVTLADHLAGTVQRTEERVRPLAHPG